MSINRDDEETSNANIDVGSLPKHNDVPNDAAKPETDDLPYVLLMGLRGCGKTSIQKVVFQKMSPNETLFIGTNNTVLINVINYSAFINFKIFDFPGHYDFSDSEFDMKFVLQKCASLIYVIDGQDDEMGATLNRLHKIVTTAYKINNKIKFDVFIHKVDGLTEDSKMDSHRDIRQKVYDDILESGFDQKIYISFHLTSIYDHSIFEGFSRVVQKIIPQHATLENFLNIISNASGIEKAFLFDVKTKIYVATDSSPVDIQSHELCCDMIDVVLDLSNVYDDEQAPSNGLAFDEKSSSTIKLNNGTILYLKEVCKFLAFVCIFRVENFENRRTIDYNLAMLRRSIEELIKCMDKQKQSTQDSKPLLKNE